MTKVDYETVVKSGPYSADLSTLVILSSTYRLWLKLLSLSRTKHKSSREPLK